MFCLYLYISIYIYIAVMHTVQFRLKTNQIISLLDGEAPVEFAKCRDFDHHAL